MQMKVMGAPSGQREPETKKNLGSQIEMNRPRICSEDPRLVLGSKSFPSSSSIFYRDSSTVNPVLGFLRGYFSKQYMYTATLKLFIFLE